MTSKLKFLLHLADTSQIKSHRLQETVGKMPELEIEMALANIGLDQLGQCRSLYQHVAELVGHTDEDQIALQRDAWDMYNHLIVELPNGNFADIIAKNFYSDVFTFHLYSAIVEGNDEWLSAFAIKSLKEITYHVKYYTNWVLRLGDGTEESHLKMQNALDYYLDYTPEFFNWADYELEIFDQLNIETKDLQTKWKKQIQDIFDEATLNFNDTMVKQNGGKKGNHTEYLGYILSDIQYMQNKYPNMVW